MGAALVRRYAPHHEIIAWTRAQLDVRYTDRILPALAEQDYDVVIYTAGVTNVDYCEDHNEESLLTNAEAPRLLAEACADKGAKLIHVSTDYVFDGKSPTPRTELDEPNPGCAYGRAKLLGEQNVLNVSSQFLVLRVSWLFGPDKPSFPDMVLSRAMSSDRVEAISDKVACPTYSEDLAAWIQPMLSDDRYQGLLHLCNHGSTNWRDYGQMTLDIARDLGLPIKATVVGRVSRLDFPAFKAVRPEFTAFDTSKFEALSGIKPRPWEQALEEYLRSKYLCAQA